MKWLSFPLVKVTLFYSIGIATQAHLTLTNNHILICALVLLGVSALLYVISLKSVKPKVSYGLTVLCLFFFLGNLNFNSRLPQNNSHHYSNYLQTGGSSLLQLKIIKPIKATDYYERYHTQITGVNKSSVSGLVLLLIKKDSSCTSLAIGQTFITKKQPILINSATNPYQFNYKAYLESQHIYHKISANRLELISTKSEGKSLRYWANQVQQKYSVIITSKINDPVAASVLKALLVGYKTDLDPTVKKSFANAGVLHLLAVSGLHVGIVLLLVQRMLWFLKSFKNGRLWKLILSLGAIWCFAAITGFSASVVRATFMFSLFAIGQQFNRGHNSINTLFISALIMLCVNPFYLLQVGFQLSYAAVFFILLLYPKLVSLWIPKQRLIRKVWQLCCVSLSAQLGVMPLSLYYFNEFPTLFLASNLILVPMIGVLLSLGLVLCSLQFLIQVPDWCFDILNIWVASINKFALWISKIDFAVIHNIYLSKLQVVVLFISLLSVYLAFTDFKKHRLQIICSCWGLFLLSIGLNKYNRPQEELIVLNTFGQTIISHKYNQNLALFSDTITPNEYTIQGYKIVNGIKSQSINKLPRFFIYNSNEIIIPSVNATLPSDSIQISTLILTKNTKINLSRWLAKLKPALVIADGSSYKNVVNSWRKSTTNQDIRFHDTATQGAYRFKLDK